MISDEIHAPLTLPGATYTPFLTLPGAGQIGVSVVSPSKAFNLAGLKCTTVVTPPHAADRADPRPAALGEPRGYVRLNFGTSTEVLELAVDRMASAL